MLPPKSSAQTRAGSSAAKSEVASSASRRRIARAELRFDSAERMIPATELASRHDSAPRPDALETELARLLSENLPEHAVVLLDSQGYVVRWNVGAERLLGFTADEVIGRSYTSFFASDDRRSRESAPPVDGRRETEALFLRRDGSTFPVHLTFLSPADDRALGGFVLLIHDVTERNRTEELLRSRFVETAHLARLSVIGQMVAEFAHEINQPLAAAANYARACINFGRSGRCVIAPEALEWMERSAAQAMRAVQIAKRLGAFVKKADGERTFVQVNTMVEQAVVLIRSMLQGGVEALAPITIETDFTASALEITADPVQIEQVILNLMRNAVEAMNEVKTRRHTLTLRTSIDAEFITVSIGDTGPGVAPDKLARLFDPFFTTKPSGLGLGLSICRTIVEQHGGRMTVASSPAGTVFSFTLPLPPGGPLPC